MGNVFNKIKWVAGILLIFMVLLTTNLIDKKNFRTLKNSVVTIYEDRVVASDIIFEITVLVQEKEIALALDDSLFLQVKNARVNDQIATLLDSYAQTRLTTEEQSLFGQLKADFSQLKQHEEQYLQSEGENKVEVFGTIDNMVHHLYDLSKVQLSEGQRQMERSAETMAVIDLFTQMEIIIMILLAIIVQIIILYKPKVEEME